MLEQLADYTETAQETKQKMQSAMVYPIIMLFVSMLVVGVLMVKVVPKLLELFANNNAELQLFPQLVPTRCERRYCDGCWPRPSLHRQRRFWQLVQRLFGDFDGVRPAWTVDAPTTVLQHLLSLIS